MEKTIHATKINFAKFTSLIGLFVLLVISAVLSPAFLKPINVQNVLRQIVPNGIAACGVTIVILSGGIDLSIGSMFALAGVVTSLILPVMPWPIAVLLVLIMGVALGLFHGLSITKLNVPPFIVTLAGLTAYRGLAFLLTGAANIPIVNKNFSTALGSGKVSATVIYAILGLFLLFAIYSFQKELRSAGGKKLRSAGKLSLIFVGIAYAAYLSASVGWLSVQILFLGAILLISLFILNKTVFGRQIYAVGCNYKAAKMAGIKADLTLIKIYAFAGFLSTLAGVLIAAKLQAGVPAAGNGGELDAIAAAVIGGTSLSGGVGKLMGTVIGVLLIGVLNNMLSLLNVSADLQSIFKGIIILAAVVIDMKFKKE